MIKRGVNAHTHPFQHNTLFSIASIESGRMQCQSRYGSMYICQTVGVIHSGFDRILQYFHILYAPAFNNRLIQLHRKHTLYNREIAKEFPMPSHPSVIRVRNLVKKYTISGSQEQYLTLYDAMAMAAAFQLLPEDPYLQEKMEKSGIEDIRLRFGLKLQIERFLHRYKDILYNYDYLCCTSMHNDHRWFV